MRITRTGEPRSRAAPDLSSVRLRSLVPLLGSALLAAALPAGSVAAEPADSGPPPGVTAESDPPQRVTAVLRGDDGKLHFRRTTVGSWRTARDTARRWRTEPRVVAVDVAHRVQASVLPLPDPLQSQQWGLRALRVPEAWEVRQATGQVVAVVDTGVDARHPDLSGAVVAGKDLVNPALDGRSDPSGHGTHVAGVIAAVAGNARGGAGVALGAKVLPVRVLDGDGSGYDDDVAEGIVWAADHGAKVINLSLGGAQRSALLEEAVEYALASGAVVVAAAGNEALVGDPVEWPAAIPGVLAVGAVGRDGVRARFSSSGRHLALAAPGVDILSTVPGGYASVSGTSMAAPFVAASAALVRANEPALTPAEVGRRLRGTAMDLGPAGHDRWYGHGRVDLLRALRDGAAGLPVPPEPPAAPPHSWSAGLSVADGSIDYGQDARFTARLRADGVPVAGIPVLLQRLTSSGRWIAVDNGNTDRTGTVQWSVRPRSGSRFRVAMTETTSASIRLGVAQVATGVVGRDSRGAVVTGEVRPRAAARVVLERKRADGRWVTVRRTTSRADGSFRLRASLPRGTVVRLRVAPRPGLLGGVGRGLRLR